MTDVFVWVDKFGARNGIKMNMVLDVLLSEFGNRFSVAIAAGVAKLGNKNRVLWRKELVDQAIAKIAEDNRKEKQTFVRWPKEYWPETKHLQPLLPRHGNLKSRQTKQDNKKAKEARKLAAFRKRKEQSNRQAFEATERLRNSRVKTALALHAEVLHKSGARAFMESDEWQHLRRLTLDKYGRKCMCCGETNAPIHVDHIRPRSMFPELALDPDNLQVLCQPCNEWKSDKVIMDYRPQRQRPDNPSALVGTCSYVTKRTRSKRRKAATLKALIKQQENEIQQWQR